MQIVGFLSGSLFKEHFEISNMRSIHEYTFNSLNERKMEFNFLRKNMEIEFEDEIKPSSKLKYQARSGLFWKTRDVPSLFILF